MDVSFKRPNDNELATLTTDLKEKHGDIYGFIFGDEQFLIYRGLTRGDMKKILDSIDEAMKEQVPESIGTEEEIPVGVQQKMLIEYQHLETEYVIRFGVIWPNIEGTSSEEFDKFFKVGIYDRLHGAIKEASAFDAEVSIKKL